MWIRTNNGERLNVGTMYRVIERGVNLEVHYITGNTQTFTDQVVVAAIKEIIDGETSREGTQQAPGVELRDSIGT